MSEIKKSRRYSSSGRTWGIFLLLIGTVILLKRAEVFLMPEWLFTWPMLLITFGVFLGIRHGFYSSGALLIILVSGFSLANNYLLNGELSYYIWPIVIISSGLFFILRPRSISILKEDEYTEEDEEEGDDDEDDEDDYEKEYKKGNYVDTIAVFGSIKKNIVAKDFKGGDAIAVLGGTQIDLTQADIDDEAWLDVFVIFGSIKIIVPSNWEIKSEVTNVFGNVQDKRPVSSIGQNANKVLHLDGTAIFGGIEINSF